MRLRSIVPYSPQFGNEGKKERLHPFHIIGPYAPMLIQEVINVVANDVQLGWIGGELHIHPAMPELIVATLSNLDEPHGGR